MPFNPKQNALMHIRDRQNQGLMHNNVMSPSQQPAMAAMPKLPQIESPMAPATTSMVKPNIPGLPKPSGRFHKIKSMLKGM